MNQVDKYTRRKFLIDAFSFVSYFAAKKAKDNFHLFPDIKIEKNEFTDAIETEIDQAYLSYLEFIKYSEKYELKRKYKELYGDGYLTVSPELFWLKPSFKQMLDAFKKATFFQKDLISIHEIWKKEVGKRRELFFLINAGKLVHSEKYPIIPSYDVGTEPERREDFELLTRKIGNILRNMGMEKLPWRILIKVVPQEEMKRRGVGDYQSNDQFFEKDMNSFVGIIRISDENNLSTDEENLLTGTIFHELGHSFDVAANLFLTAFMNQDQICHALALRCDSIMEGRKKHYSPNKSFIVFSEYQYPELIVQSWGEHGYQMRQILIPSLIEKRVQADVMRDCVNWQFNSNDDLLTIFNKNKKSVDSMMENSPFWKFVFHKIREHEELSKFPVSELLFYFFRDNSKSDVLSKILLYLSLIFLTNEVLNLTLPKNVISDDEKNDLMQKASILLVAADQELEAEQFRIVSQDIMNGRKVPTDQAVVQYVNQLVGVFANPLQ